MVESKGVKISYHPLSMNSKKMWKWVVDSNGSHNPTSCFISCGNAQVCNMLSDGKIFPCAIAPNLRIYSEYFKKNMVFSDKDGIDIYLARDADEILKKLSEPMDRCRYCNVGAKKYGLQWSVSQKSIQEWS